MTSPIKKIIVPALCSFLLFASIVSTQAAISITRMRCEYLVNPLGINETQPRLDWLLTTEIPGKGAGDIFQPTPRNLTQKSYRILVASSAEGLAQNQGDLWDSGEVASDATNQIVYVGSALT